MSRRRYPPPDPGRRFGREGDPSTLGAWGQTVALVCLLVGLALIGAECSRPAAPAKAPPVQVQP